ncbi:MAG: hypothetical protein JSV86_10670 [Gemmatimonadota bacterium]|nr:MAG: hypothetical protein JSV86_10670 [Gemmatimonadota bacterium]
MAKTYQIVEWLGAPKERTFEESTVLIAAEPYRTQVIQRLQNLEATFLKLDVFKQPGDVQIMVDDALLAVHKAAKAGAEATIPAAEKRVKRAVIGVEIGLMLLGAAGSILWWKHTRGR